MRFRVEGATGSHPRGSLAILDLSLGALPSQVLPVRFIDLARTPRYRSRIGRSIGCALIPVLDILRILLVLVVLSLDALLKLLQLDVVRQLVEVVRHFAQDVLILANLSLLLVIELVDLGFGLFEVKLQQRLWIQAQIDRFSLATSLLEALEYLLHGGRLFQPICGLRRSESATGVKTLHRGSPVEGLLHLLI